jgi:hypothetical protein
MTYYGAEATSSYPGPLLRQVGSTVWRAAALESRGWSLFTCQGRHGDVVRREARAAHSTTGAQQPRRHPPGPVLAAHPWGAAVPSNELRLRAGSGKAPPSVVQVSGAR